MIRTECSWPPSATPMAPTPSAASSAPRTGGGPGGRSCPGTTTRAPSTLPSGRATRMSSTRPSGRRAVRRGASTRRPMVPAAASSSPPTAEAPGRRSSATAFPRSTGASGSPSRRAGRIASTRWSMRAPGWAASTARTTAARPGATSAAIAASGVAAGTSAASPWSRAIRTPSMPATPRSTVPATAAAASSRSRGRPAATTTTSSGSTPSTRSAASWPRTRAPWSP